MIKLKIALWDYYDDWHWQSDCRTFETDLTSDAINKAYNNSESIIWIKLDDVCDEYQNSVIDADTLETIEEKLWQKDYKLFLQECDNEIDQVWDLYASTEELFFLLKYVVEKTYPECWFNEINITDETIQFSMWYGCFE